MHTHIVCNMQNITRHVQHCQVYINDDVDVNDDKYDDDNHDKEYDDNDDYDNHYGGDHDHNR